MKLRINHNSLRFRLSPAEVAQLDETGSVSQTTEFGPGNEFIYSLRTQTNASSIRGILHPHAISVEIPAALVSPWRNSNQIGLHHTQPLPDEKSLDILIEKDFECLEGQIEDPTVALYPNPNKQCLTNTSGDR